MHKQPNEKQYYRKEACAVKNFYAIGLVVLLISISLANAFAVSEAALLFLLISPSPRANGMGDTFMALPENDAMAAIYNPGNLGLFSLQNITSIGFYPQHVPWLPNLTSDLFYNCRAINFGFRLNKNFFAGMGYHYIFVDLGKQLFTDEHGNPYASFGNWEKAQALTLGIGGNFGVNMGLGMSIKYIESQLGARRIDSGYKSTRADIFAYDFGGVVQVPVFELLNPSFDLPLTNNLSLYPLLVPAIAYSLNNYGDEIVYIDESQADPIARVARIGYSIDSGILLDFKNSSWKLISWKWAREAEDLLVKRSAPGDRIEYQSGIGDIRFFHDLIEWKANPVIIKRGGWEINLGETFYFREGKYDDPEGLVFYKTTGYGIGITGLLKLGAEIFSQNQTIKFLADHVDIQYHWSKMKIAPWHPLYGTEFKGINLVIK